MLRYFKHYGPATLKDFCHWSGLPQGASRQCLDSLDGLLDAHSHDDRDYFTHGAIAGSAPENELFLLGKFDPLFVSYSHKDWIAPPKLQKQVWRNAGWVEAVIIDSSRLAGVWRHAITGKKMSVQVTQFSKLKVPAKRKVQERAERLASFWEKDLDVVTFK